MRPLPKGAVALAVARGERPRSWLEHVEPSRPATGQGRRPRREGKGRLIEGPAPRGATVAVLEQEGPEVLGLNGPAPSIEHTLSWTGLDLPKTKLVLMGRVLRVAARDLTGDDQLEVVVTTTCETVMFSITGTSLLRSEQRCCGC